MNTNAKILIIASLTSAGLIGFVRGFVNAMPPPKPQCYAKITSIGVCNKEGKCGTMGEDGYVRRIFFPVVGQTFRGDPDSEFCRKFYAERDSK